MSRDYDFWVYIVTNQLDSVLYIGMTNDLTRRISEHRSGEVPGFTADYRCHNARKAVEEVVPQKEGRANRSSQSSLV